ncbi:hypothetical protein AgCh_029859 [Apium graveolens]
MERKAVILLVIAVVALVTCNSVAADDDCCLKCAARCIIWRFHYYDLCYKPCCDCCHGDCSGPPQDPKIVKDFANNEAVKKWMESSQRKN